MNKQLKEQMIEMRQKGLLLHEIAEALNAKGELCPTGAKWTNQNVSALLIKWGHRKVRRYKRAANLTRTIKAPIKKSDDKNALIDLVITSSMDKGTKLKLIEALIE